MRIRTGLNHHASQSPGTRAPAAALDGARPAPEQPASDPVTLLELNYDGLQPNGMVGSCKPRCRVESGAS